MMTKKTLTQYGVNYVVKNVEEDSEALAFLKDQGFQAVPVVFSGNNEPIKGFRPDLLKNLKEAI
jgi:glutaredoxin-like protein NrdH